MESLLLAGDIGATKTILALYTAAAVTGEAASPGEPLRRVELLNARFRDFDELLDGFLDGIRPERACFGVAGPVGAAGRVRMTNLNWSLDAQALQARHGIGRAWLINDLVATAMGAVSLPASDLHILNPGQPEPGAAIAVLAPGSGLGEAFLLPTAQGWRPCPSEGGHAGFAPETGEQMELLAFMRTRHPHVSVERVCSGLALPGLLDFVATRLPLPPWFRQEMEASADKTPVIVRAALRAAAGEADCLAATATLRLFTEILAAEAANLTLKTLARGGLFLGGGLAPRLLPLLDPARFMAVFARGLYQGWLAQIPIRVILNPGCALLGAAVYAASQAP